MTSQLATNEILIDPLGPTAPLEELDRLYFGWLNDALPFVRASETNDGLVLSVAGAPLIRLGNARARAGELYRPILGGWLARPGGELAFCEQDGCALLAVRHYSPRLPRWLYRWTQQRAHREVARRFAAALPRLRTPLR